MTGVELVARARSVTDDEVQSYRDSGWAFLEQLVSPELADQMLCVAQRAIRPDGSPSGAEDHTTRKVVDLGWWTEVRFLARDDGVEPFRSVVFSKDMGRNAQRLMGRDVPVRYWSDLVAPKMPAGEGGSTATSWHQDLPVTAVDRVGMLTFWIALVEVTPDRGAMRFLSGSQREGSLGWTDLSSATGVLDAYPELERRYELSPPLTLKPGDATVHHGLVVHGAPVNSTSDPRWAYIFAYVPADVLYTGAPSSFTDGLGIEPRQPMEHANFPIVYP